jgi:hypothetical protein
VDRAIILGIAPCLEDDLAQLGDHSLYDFIAVGLGCSDRVLFDIQHVCTYHTSDLEMFKSRRSVAGGNLDYITHSHTKPKTGVQPDVVWPLVGKSPYSGSSSYLAAQVAVGLGYDKIIMCGCPMEGKNLTNSRIVGYDTFQVGWIEHADKLQGKVRSMSGWTRKFLGYPDEHWLNA